MAPKLDRAVEALFRRVDKDLAVNWHAIIAANSRVSRVSLSSSGKRKLDDVFVPWHTSGGLPVSHGTVDQAQFPQVHSRYPEKGDTALTVSDAAVVGFSHPWMSEQRLKAHWPTSRVQMVLPAYYVERGYLLLDGNHRSIATLRAQVEYDVELAVVHGPIDPHVLRDLAVFS